MQFYLLDGEVERTTMGRAASFREILLKTKLALEALYAEIML